MDAATYPDKTVLELAQKFVCIRVEHDRCPDLVKQYGVKSLPDVRLLDSEGKERVRLIGFTSAAKLAAQCRAVLSGQASEKPVAEDVRNVPVTPEAIGKAVKQGADYLLAAWKKGWKPNPGMDPASQVLFALAATKADPSGEDMAKLIQSVTSAPLLGTYEVAFQAMALATLDSKKYQDRLKQCVKFFLDTQLESGEWTYRAPPSGAPPKIGDHSNSAFALLALGFCRRAGIDVPEPAIKKALAGWRASQNPDGGWGYRTDRETESYASMTENGVASLRLCGEASDKAVSWLVSNYSIAENKGSAYQQGRQLYHLYAMERTGLEKIGDHDGYQEGAAYLLGTQRADGSWDDGAETPIPNTCWAVLFLARATRNLK